MILLLSRGRTAVDHRLVVIPGLYMALWKLNRNSFWKRFTLFPLNMIICCAISDGAAVVTVSIFMMFLILKKALSSMTWM